MYKYISVSKIRRDKSDNDDGKRNNSEHEEGEIEDYETHPMVTITKIDPNDIPEVSNKFLMRTTAEDDVAGGVDGGSNETAEKIDKDKDDKRDKNDRRRHQRDRGGGGSSDRRETKK